MKNASPPRRIAITMLKITLGAALVGWLTWQARENAAFETLAAGRKRWSLLSAGLATTVAAVTLSFVRWRLVARAAGLELPLGEALRYGALGFALNFVGPGSVSGDVVKAIALSRNRKGKRVAAAATVVVDRFLGLFAMLLTASFAIIAFSVSGAAPSGAAWLVCLSTLCVTGGAILGCGLLFLPGVASGAVARRMSSLPLIGDAAGQIVSVWGDYRRRPGGLAWAVGLSLLVDVLLVASFYCVAVGLPFEAPSLVEHFFIVPVSLIAAAVPITPFGLGVREGVSDLMYQGFGAPVGQGTLIAAGHALTMLAVGGVAVVYYLIDRGRAGSLVECPPELPEPSGQEPAATPLA